MLEKTAKLFKESLDDDVLRIWRDLLSLCSETEAIAALKKWSYEGVWFPKPAEILQLVANARDERQVQEIGCSKECQRRHFTSYGENDLRWLLGRRMMHKGENWSDAQWEQLLSELDAKRSQGAPAWRKESGQLFG